MKLGIYDLDFMDLDIKERFSIYKEVGFTHVGFYLDDDYLKRKETYVELIDIAKEVGIEISQVHLDYKNSNMLSLMDDNSFLRYIEIKVDEAISYGIKDLVLHASKGDEPPLISKYSLSRLKKLNRKLVKYNIRLCFENVRVNTNLDKVMKLNLDNICICYDTGHGHCYLDEEEFISKYKDKIVTTHIHDNFGSDDHMVVGKGNINWNNITRLLDTTNREFDYLECFPPRGVTLDKEEFISFVKEMYESYELNFKKSNTI